MSYRRSAELYDLLYGWKDYAGEAERIRQLVSERLPQAASLLDVACGTGRHLEVLRNWYTVEGLDAEAGLLAVARRRLPGVPLHHADMRSFSLDARFDVVTCLFSAIGYMQTPAALSEAVATMSRHLAPGGMLIVEPWLAPDVFETRHIGGPTIGQGPEIAVVRMNGNRVEGRLSILDFHYLVGRPGTVEYFTETHSVGLFTNDEYRDAFVAAGLSVEHDPDGLMGRGLWIGRGA
jgi:SAM-dependent methyltransferase